MSFFSDNRNVRPGPIEGNPLSGLRHRVAISARRILDSAICTQTMENLSLPISGIPYDIEAPVKVMSLSSTSPTSKVSDLTITRIRERPGFASVACTITTPLTIECECAKGNRHVGTSQIASTQNIVLFVPRQSIFPFEIEVTSSTQATTASVDPQLNLRATLCQTLVTRVISETDILLPTYGHAPLNPGVIFDRDACQDVFDLPLFPSGHNNR